VVLKHAVGATFPVNFALGFYKVLLGGRLSMEDLAVISPPLVKGMETVCLMDENKLEDMYMDFTTDLFKVTKIKEGDNESERIFTKNYELCANGSQKSVSSANRVEYLRDCIMTHLCCVSNKETENALRELIIGMQHMCPRENFNYLSPVELQLVVEGCRDIDVAEWMEYSDMQNVTEFNVESVNWFWSIVHELGDVDKRLLLKFATASTAVPAGGFQNMNPKFRVYMDPPSDALPTSHTCFKTIHIPAYPTEEKMRQKLLMAIRNTGSLDYGLL
jgi:hypothetical protein